MDAAVPRVVTALPNLPARPVDAHKGQFGRVLVVAGSRGMTGAAVLCASAALRGGAGLVRIATPAECAPVVAAGNPCCMTLPLPSDALGRICADAVPLLTDQLHASDVAVIGPGLGQSSDLVYLVATVLRATRVPLVLDADALNALAGHGDWLRERGAFVLTPHPGEFGRLMGLTTAQVQTRRQELALRFVADHGGVLVLKGSRTIVTDGQRLFVNTTGNPGMATGGSGDVLGGLIAALIGQGFDLFAAAQLGVYLHGLAGDLARDALGETALIASDLLDLLPHALQTLGAGDRAPGGTESLN